MKELEKDTQENGENVSYSCSVYYEFPPPVIEDHSDAPHRSSEPMKPEEWGPAI